MNIFLKILAHTRAAMKRNFLSNMLGTQKIDSRKRQKSLKNDEKVIFQNSRMSVGY